MPRKPIGSLSGEENNREIPREEQGDGDAMGHGSMVGGAGMDRSDWVGLCMLGCG